MDTTGAQLILAFIIGLSLLVFLVLKTKVHAFLALIIASVTIGLIAGLESSMIADSITVGFGGTLGSIGIIIGFGVIMGEIYQLSGAATQMARVFLKICGKGKEEMALAITGFIVSIPIFCDSAFVILSPVAKAISRQTKKSAVGLCFSLAGGLVITHTLVPPTPGPLAVAGLFGAELGKFILISIILAIPITAATTIYAVRVLGKQIYQIPADDGEGWERPAVRPEVSCDLTVVDGKDLPSPFLSFLPIVLPILLILGQTISRAAGLQGTMAVILNFLGTPIIAVGIALVICIYTLALKIPRQEALSKMENGVKAAGVILLVTGAGGSLGRVLTTTGIGNYLAEAIAAQPIPIIVLPFLIATILRFAQGSATVAMITAAGICAPIVEAADGNVLLCALAACVGSLFCSHFNDSFFWVTNRLTGISDNREMIKCWTVTTTIAWATGFVILMLVYFLFGNTI